jgi:subtilisin family serine protease
MSVPDALKLIGRSFPGVTVDANHRFDLSAGKKGVFPQKAIGWSKVRAKCGRGVRIGMIDSAIDLTHPALKKQKVKYKSFHDPKHNPAPPIHGTAIAAMLIGKTMPNGWSGLLPGAKLFAANMFEVNAQDKVIGNSVALLKGINWLAKQKVHVINLSIAGADNKMFRIATKFARKKGVILVASVGNWGYKKKPAFPAAYPDVFAVTAITGKRKIYSMANQGKYVDFSAPGVNVWTAVPGGGKVQTGTSFATPFISVLVGLDVARGVKPNPDKLRKLMRRRIIDLGKVGRDSVYGWGLINRKRTCMT